MTINYQNWFNPNGASILKGGAAARLFEEKDDDGQICRGAEVLVIKPFDKGLTAYTGNLYEEDFFPGGPLEGEAEQLVGVPFEEIAESWEDRELASFYQMAANKLNQTRLKNLKPLYRNDYMVSVSEARDLLHKLGFFAKPQEEASHE